MARLLLKFTANVNIDLVSSTLKYFIQENNIPASIWDYRFNKYIIIIYFFFLIIKKLGIMNLL